MAKIRIKSNRLSDNIVAHYKLNDNLADTVVLDETDVNNGTLVGGDTTADISQAGKINKCFLFNGIDDYISCGTDSSLNLTSNLSICAWVKLTSTGAVQAIISRLDDGTPDYHGYWLGAYDSNTKLTFWDGGALRYTTTSKVIVTGEWIHVVATVDGTTLKFYCDGEQEGDAVTITALGSEPTMPFYIGAQDMDGVMSRFLKGYMDDVRIYNKTLSDAEVKALYNGGRGTESENPTVPAKLKLAAKNKDLSTNTVAHYKMNDDLSVDATLAAHYKLADAEADTVVINEKGTNGVLVGGDDTTDISVAGKPSLGLLFGAGDYVDCTDLDLIGTSDFSVSCWIKTTDDTCTLLSDRRYSEGFQVQIAADGSIGFGMHDSVDGWAAFNFGGSDITDDTWYHIVVSVDRDGFANLYVNGVSDGTSKDVSSRQASIDGNEKLTIANRPVSYDADYEGIISDMRLYLKALSQGEANAIYNEGSGTSKEGLTVINENGANAGLVGGDETADITTTGKIGKALDFNGTDDYVDTGQTFQTTLQASFSISTWIKPDDGQPAAGKIIFGSYNASAEERVMCQLWTDGKLYFVYEANNVSTTQVGSTSAFNNGQETWHHVVFVAEEGSATGMRIYIDGVLDGSASSSGVTFSNFATDVNCYLGGWNNAGTLTQPFAGGIDDFRMFDKVLSVAEIKGLYNNGRGTEEDTINTGLIALTDTWDVSDAIVAQYKMNDNSTTDENLVAHYKMNDNAANTTVTNEKGTDGALQGGDNTEDISEAGVINNCFRFNGTDDYVELEQDFEATFQDSFTYCLWCKPDDGQAAISQMLFSARNPTGDNSDTWIYIGTEGSVAGYYMSEGQSVVSVDTAFFPDGATSWTHIAYQVEKTSETTVTSRLYVNGVEVDSDDATITMSNFTAEDNAMLARYSYSTPAQWYAGLMDDVRVYNKALSSEEIQAIYNQGNGTEKEAFAVEASPTSIIANAVLIGGDNTADKHVVGKIHGALQFNGTDDYVDCGTSFPDTFNGSFSVSMWVNLTDGQPSAAKSLWGNHTSADYAYVQIQTDGDIVFGYKSNGVAADSAWTADPLPNGETGWIHLVFVADSTVGGIGGLKIYREGVVQTLSASGYGNTTGVTFADWAIAYNNVIGAINVDGTLTQFYAGSYDNFCIFNKALTAKEVWGLYNTGRGTEKLKDLG